MITHSWYIVIILLFPIGEYTSKFEKIDVTRKNVKPKLPKLKSYGIMKVHKILINIQITYNWFPKVSEKWEFIGNILQVTDKEIDSIRSEHHSHASCCEEMLRKWLQSSFTFHTWKAILVALSVAGENELAENIASELDQNPEK